MVYLDNNSTTNVPREVVEAMLPHFSDTFYNASSVAADIIGLNRVVANARREISLLIKASESSKIVFTSGATESNNWIAGLVSESHPKPRHLVASAIEHPSVIEPLRRLEKKGWELTLVPVDKHGVLDLPALKNVLSEETALVSVMAANNETGVIQPIGQAAQLVKARAPNAAFHTDATQVVGKLDICFDDAWENVDFVSISAHKFHGPKGVGALIFREGLNISSMLLGGEQQDGYRAGTLNIPGIVGMATAATLVRTSLREHMNAVASLRNAFEQTLKATFPDVIIHSAFVDRLCNTSCFSLPGLDANHATELLARNGICVGTGSACSSGALHPPRTLLAMGVDYELAGNALRVSLSRFSTAEDLSNLLLTLQRIRSNCETEILAETKFS